MDQSGMKIKFIFASYAQEMLTTIAVILIILWLLGWLAFPVIGGFIHILLVAAIILFLIRVIQGQNPLR